MEVLMTPFEGVFEIRHKIFPDERGWFHEFFNKKAYANQQVNLPEFVQDNLSFSKKGVVRGLHLQLAPNAQAKLVSVIKGKVWDVIVDLRPGSSTFGKTFTLTLDEASKNSLFVPEGFAHGFAALEDSLFFYKCSSHYEPKSETGIAWNDTRLNIPWPIERPVVSKKDQELPTLDELLQKSLISQHA